MTLMGHALELTSSLAPNATQAISGFSGTGACPAGTGLAGTAPAMLNGLPHRGQQKLILTTRASAGLTSTETAIGAGQPQLQRGCLIGVTLPLVPLMFPNRF